MLPCVMHPHQQLTTPRRLHDSTVWAAAAITSTAVFPTHTYRYMIRGTHPAGGTNNRRVASKTYHTAARTLVVYSDGVRIPMRYTAMIT